MSAPINDGGPAFPMSGDPNVDFDRGMSVRMWLIGQAIAGNCGYGSGSITTEAVADRAIEIADLVIAKTEGRAE